MRSAYVKPDAMAAVLAMLTPENRLICEVMLKTGLRVGDVVRLRCEDVKERMTVKESKTGKGKRVYLGADLARRLRCGRSAGWCFPNARDEAKHRTRQAVWKDIKRAAKLLRYKENVTPHTCRKVYAVEYYDCHGLDATRRALNHDRAEVTMLYALADVITSDKHRQRRKSKK